MSWTTGPITFQNNILVNEANANFAFVLQDGLVEPGSRWA